MLIPTIHFPGTCKEAITLYQKALHAEVTGMVYYGDAPAGSNWGEKGNADRVMHAEMVVAGSRVNACDVKETVSSNGMCLLALVFDAADEISAAYQALKEGGNIITELSPQFWSGMYADVEDRFGVRWQLMLKANA